jgi:hypothetical protein
MKLSVEAGAKANGSATRGILRSYVGPSTGCGSACHGSRLILKKI